MEIVTIVVGLVAGSITILGLVRWVWHKRRPPPPPPQPEWAKELKKEKVETRALVAKFFKQYPPPPGTAGIGTEELAKAAGPDTPARLREALEFQAQHRERKAIDALFDAFRSDLEAPAKIELHMLIGNSFFRLDELEKAEGHYRQALDTSREASIREGEGIALGVLGVIYAEQGNLERAEEHLERGLAIDRATGNRLGVSRSLNNLGLLYEKQARLYMEPKDAHAAEQSFSAALRNYHETGNRVGEADALGKLGMIANVNGDREKACKLLKEAAAIYEEIGDPRQENAPAALEDLGCE